VDVSLEVIPRSGLRPSHPPDLRRDLWHLIVLIDLMNSTFTVTIIS
jgi:hypothetical protein